MFWQHARTFCPNMLILVSSPSKHGVTLGIFLIHRKILCRIHIDFVLFLFLVGDQVVKKRYFK
jgi:hypothetical protein